MPSISFSARTMFLVFAGISAFLIVMHLLVFAEVVYGGHGQLLGMVDRFDLDQEDNIPTWFSTMILATASVYAWVIAQVKTRKKDRYARHWKVMAGILMYLSLDEGASIHETFNLWAPRIFGGGIDLGFVILRGWVDVGLVAVAVVALYFARFVTDLPRRTCALLMASAFVYVFGAAVVESMQYTTFDFTPSGYAWHVSVAAEEGMEMLGACLAIYALADYAAEETVEVKVSFVP